MISRAINYEKIRPYALVLLTALLAFFAGEGLFKVMAERSLGSIVRHNIGTIAVLFILFAFYSENFIPAIFDFKKVDLPSIKQAVPLIVFAIVSGIAIFVYGGFGIIYSGIILFILLTLGFSVFYIFTGKPFNAICLFWCAHPFIYFVQKQVENIGFEKPVFDDLVIPFSAVYILVLFVSVVLVNMMKTDFLRDKPARFVYWLIFLSIPSIFFSGNPMKSFIFFVFDMVMPVIYFIVMVAVIKDEKQIERAIQFLLFSFFILVGLTLYFYAGKEDSEFLLRLYGAKTAIVAPVTLACLAAILFPFSFLLYKIKNSRWYLALTALFMLVIVMSDYRTAVGGLLIAIAMFYTLAKMSWIKKVFGIVFMVVILAGLFSIFYRIETKMNIENRLFAKSLMMQTRASFDELTSSRLEIWQSAIDMIKDHPFMGIGGGMWKDKAFLYKSKEYITHQPGYGYLAYYAADPHNIFLYTYVKYGVLAVLFFSYIVFYVIRQSYILYVKEENVARKPIITGVHISLLIWVFVSNFDYTFYDYDRGDLLSGFLFWTLIGFALIYVRIKKEAKAQAAGIKNA